jgi:hypothetical protein
MSTLYGLLGPAFHNGELSYLAFEVSYVAGELGEVVIGYLQPSAW